MQKILTLNTLDFVGTDGEPFDLNLKENFTLKIETPFDFEKMFFFFKNNGEESYLRGEKDRNGEAIVTVPKNVLKVGRIDLTVQLREGMKLLRKWVVSPLLISKCNENLSVSDYLKTVETKISELEKRVQALEEKNDNLFKL